MGSGFDDSSRILLRKRESGLVPLPVAASFKASVLERRRLSFLLSPRRSPASVFLPGLSF